MNPHNRTWTVVEKFFLPPQQHYYETILTVGNGYLGTRGSFAEGYPDDMPATLVHGVFNHHEADLVPDLANVPVWFVWQIEIDGQRFRLDTGKVLGFRRELDLRNGVLTRQVLWQSPAGKVVRFEFERFASMANSHLLMQHVTITALDDIDLTAVAYFDNHKNTNIAFAEGGPLNVSHWQAEETAYQGPTGMWHGTTTQSGYRVALRQHVTTDADVNIAEYSIGHEVTGNGVQTVSLKTNETISFTRYVAIATSRDTDDVLDFTQSLQSATLGQDYDTHKSDNETIWQSLWDDMDIVIEGDEVAQLAMRFVTYHLLIAAPRHDERVSIGAKTLSGGGYKGHVFWDTELFMLPPFTLSQPSIARNLLMYRYHNLAGAREKAEEAGYKGAMFPWESTDTGQETTPRWTLPDENGHRIRIWTGDHEQHISSDIAYSLWQYWQWTGDDDFMRDYGAEIILDTAVFWESRVEWKPDQTHYELSQQVGPDEFHENVDNPVYTNRLVVWHMQHAIKTFNWLKQLDQAKADALFKQLGIAEANLEQWQHIADNMYIPRHAELNVFEQFDGYFDKEWVDVLAYTPRTTNLDVILGHKRTNASQVIKQADVVMLMTILGHELGDRDELIRNWNAYVPNTAHDSSLSPAVYAWLGAQLGLIEDAYELWMKSAGLDLENNKGNVRDGIHAAACGGLYQAIIFGFCGLHLDDHGSWQTKPNLPDWWKSISFNFYHRGQRNSVTVSAETSRVK